MQPDDPLERLWVRFLAGELSPAEQQKLLQELEQRPELRKRLLADRELDGLLSNCQEHNADAFVRLVTNALLAEKDNTRFVRDVRQKLRKRTTRRIRVSPRRAPTWPWAVAAAAVALVVVAILARWNTPRDLPSTSFGVVAAFTPEDGARLLRAYADNASEPLLVGTRLNPGDTIDVAARREGRELEHERASLELRIQDARILLSPASRIRIEADSADGPVLTQERGLAYVDSSALSRRGKHLLIRTPHASIRTEGTRFDVHVDATQSRVRMADGRVRLFNAYGEVTLGTGVSGVATATASPTIFATTATVWNGVPAELPPVTMPAATETAPAVTTTPTDARPRIARLSLMNPITAKAFADHENLTGDVVVDMAELGVNGINIEAVTEPRRIAKVVFETSGDRGDLRRVEEFPPYCVAGDSWEGASSSRDKGYYRWQPTPGTYVIVATPYGQSRTGVVAGPKVTVRLKIVDSRTTPLP